MKPLISNRKALMRFEILEKHEAGLALAGCEVKSLREGHGDLTGSFVLIRKGEAFVMGLKILRYKFDTSAVFDEGRTRKLLLSKREIDRLAGRTSERGLTVIPLDIHFNERGWAKMTIGLAKGKQGPDRKRDIKARDQRRDMDREAKNARASKYKM